MKRITAFAAIAWTLCAAALAQQPSPIMQHYRAYQAALEANDLATAEAEAAAALAASEARDGDGGRTAVLALNLATVRLLNNNAAGALEPGRRALALAAARGEASGAPVPLAHLIVNRAELAADESGAAERLSAALDVAQQARLAAAEIFDAASQLALWTFEHERYDESRRAWSIAASYAEGSRFPAGFARARAQTGEAAVVILDDLGGAGRRRMSDHAAREAYRMLLDAIVALCRLAQVQTPDGQVSIAQRAYAHALAWRAVLHAKLLSDGQRIPEFEEAQGDADGIGADGLGEVDIPMDLALPRCLVGVTLHNPNSHYPRGALRDRSLAGLAVLLRINEAGEVVDVETVARVGREEFAQAIDDPQDWRIRKLPESPTNCRMNMSVIQSVSFRLQ